MKNNSLIVPRLENGSRVLSGFTIEAKEMEEDASRVLYMPGLIYNSYVDKGMFSIQTRLNTLKLRSTYSNLVDKQVELLDSKKDELSEYESLVEYLINNMDSSKYKSFEVMEACDRYIQLFEMLVLKNFRGFYKRIFSKELEWIGNNSSFNNRQNESG